MAEFQVDEALETVPFEDLHKRALKALVGKLDERIVPTYEMDRLAQARMYDISGQAAVALWIGASSFDVDLSYLTATADGPYHLRTTIEQADIH